MFDPLKPYNELPPLPPNTDVETKAVLKKAISAGRALAELKGLGQTLPNQAMLLNTVVLQEAKDSSEIENIVTTNDAIYEALTASTTAVDSATKEVIRYREAMWQGFNALKKEPRLNTNLFLQIVQTIKEDNRGIRNAPGTVIGNPMTREVYFTPPVGETIITRKLGELEEFINAADRIDPLVKMALIHYQFEAVHPFFDGNGRTGRIINILYMVLRDLLDIPVLYMSKYIIERKSEYYRLLREVTEHGAWEPWILYMLDAVEVMSALTRQRIIDIRALLDDTLTFAKSNLPSRVYSKDIVELVFRQPYTKGQFLVDMGIAERKTAADYLQELEKIGILKRKKVGRENLYLNEKLYNLLSK